MAAPAAGLRRRANLLFFFIAFGYVLLAVRLFTVQIIQRGEWRKLADSYHVRTIRIAARRGVIKDRNGELLGVNEDAGAVSIDPSFYWNPDKFPTDRTDRKNPRKIAPDKNATAQQIASLLKLDPADVLKKITTRTSFQWLKRRVTLDEARSLREADIPGIAIDDEPRRVYPMGSLAAHVLGFTDTDGKGIAGVEQRFNTELRRTDGQEIQEVDRKGRIIPGTLRGVKEPVDGASVTLTIDSRIQQVAERELNAACTKYHAVGGTCTVMDPNTGEVLALAAYPTYDPNAPGKFPFDARRDRPVTDLYEPGSTMKGLTASAAVNEHAVSLTERFNCPGFLHIGDRVVHDVYEGPGSFGRLDLANILAFSSNVGMSQVGLRLGRDKLSQYVRQFGLLDKTGIELPGEAQSWLPKPARWDRHFTATIAFGQSISFTPLKLATAYSAVANGGTLMKPMIVKNITWPEVPGQAAKVQEFKPEAVRRVITPETAKTITGLLQGVVRSGTGKPAKIRGYTLVGKTGSAQKVIPHHGYSSDRFIASFVGFLPKIHPRVTILVTVDEPKGTHWGATTSAPVFREVARQAMWYLNVPPDNPNDIVDGSEPSTWYHAGGAHRRTARR